MANQGPANTIGKSSNVLVRDCADDPYSTTRVRRVAAYTMDVQVHRDGPIPGQDHLYAEHATLLAFGKD